METNQSEPIKRDATFSDCGKYRYQLIRQWGDGPVAMCIGLNPSTANANTDDPTIRILMKHLDALGFKKLIMTNLYAYVTSSPAKLWEVPNPQMDNDKWLMMSVRDSHAIIFCWGAQKGIDYRTKQMREWFPAALCFGKVKNGEPMHPMALMYSGIKPNETNLELFKQ